MKALVLAMAASCAAMIACSNVPQPGAQRTDVAVGPAATDSLVKLMRKSLTVPDPHATAQAMMCEIGRLYDEFGEEKADRLIREAEEAAYTWRDRKALARRDSLLHLHSFSTAECRSTPKQTESP